jgi:predicted GIY-YIG superfamily endonuclease
MRTRWTKDLIQEKALKYETRSSFKKNNNDAYLAAKRRGLLNEVCVHMKEARKPNGYWTKEICSIEAKKYKSRSEFREHNSMAYKVSCQNKFLDEVCSHMKTFFRMKRMIYAAEFSDGFVYVGLTGDLKARKGQHIKRENEAIFKHIKATGLTPVYKELTEYINFKKAQTQEEFFQKKYEKEGWKPLHSAKAGALGGALKKWDKESVMLEAKKYKTKAKFERQSSGAYNAARRMGWLDEAQSHMVPIYRTHTRESVMLDAKKYNNREDFKTKNSGAYTFAYRNGFLDEACSHMPYRYRKSRKRK